MVRFTFAGRTALSFLSFNLGWWACAFGAMKGYPWVGPALLPLWVGLHLYLSPTPLGELLFFLILCPVGFLIDTALIKSGLFTMAGAESYAPLWLVAMWILLGLTYESMLALRQRTWLLLLSGAVYGPLTYVWCEAVHLLAYSKPMWGSLLIHGVLWAALTPVLFKLRDLSLMASLGRPEAASAPAMQAQELARVLADLGRELRVPPPAPRPPEPGWQPEAGRHTETTSTTLH